MKEINDKDIFVGKVDFKILIIYFGKVLVL